MVLRGGLEKFPTAMGHDLIYRACNKQLENLGARVLTLDAHVDCSKLTST